jgi:hypothetical protein
VRRRLLTIVSLTLSAAFAAAQTSPTTVFTGPAPNQTLHLRATEVVDTTIEAEPAQPPTPALERRETHVTVSLELTSTVGPRRRSGTIRGARGMRPRGVDGNNRREPGTGTFAPGTPTSDSPPVRLTVQVRGEGTSEVNLDRGLVLRHEQRVTTETLREVEGRSSTPGRARSTVTLTVERIP